MEQTVWVPAVTAVVSAFIVGGVAFLIWGMNTLMKMTERLSRLEEGQESLRQGQAKLEEGQEELRQGQAKLELSLEELRLGQAKLEQGQEELRQGQAKLTALIFDILRLLDQSSSAASDD